MARWTVELGDTVKRALGEAAAWRQATTEAYKHPLETAEVRRNGELKARLWFDGRLQYLEY